MLHASQTYYNFKKRKLLFLSNFANLDILLCIKYFISFFQCTLNKTRRTKFYQSAKLDKNKHSFDFAFTELKNHILNFWSVFHL